VIIDPANSGILIIAALSIGLVGVVLGLFAVIRLSWLRRTYALLQVSEGRETFVDVVARTIEEFRVLRGDVHALDRELANTRGELREALRHVSVVRYDAFGDMAGRFSFSAALLDDQGDGLILTSIHGRAETRTYLKGIKGGSSEVGLSPEEIEAVKIARGDDS
jgi:hypothetical protein